MHKIDVVFRRLEEIRFVDLFDLTGVYVIWSSKSDIRPTYIGEGDIFNRFVQHRNRFPKPIRGYVTTFEGTTKQTKETAEIIETILLGVAEETNRFPLSNKKSGKITMIKKIFENHGTLKISFDGHDPFIHPDDRQSRNIKKVRLSIKGDSFLHDWKII